MGAAEQQRRAAFQAAVVEHHVGLRVYVRSLGVDPDWVDDLAQEAFLVAFRQWDTFDPGRDFGRWLRGIATNLVRNELRKESRRRLLHTELTELLLRRSAEPDPGDWSREVEAVRACLEQLPPAGRAATLGRYRDGKSAAELADLLRTTPANVRQMLLRLRRQLRQCVEARVGCVGGTA